MAKKKIFIAGHRGLVGSALVRLYETRAEWEIVTRTRSELDLLDREAVREFFVSEKPAAVILAAAKVGGIHANSTQQVEFLLQNMRIQNNVIEAAADHAVERLLFLGSSCIYPKNCPQPIKEEYLLTAPLEPTNEGYALAKITGVKLCQHYSRQYGKRFISAMPSNLYGPNDNFDLQTSHVLPALVRKFHEAKVNASPSVSLWGSGSPRREFLHVDDLAEACASLLDNYESDEPINVGVGEDVTIRELAELVRDTVGFVGELEWDASKPDGTPRKLMDTSRLAEFGWHPKISLQEGLRRTYEWYLANPSRA
ncbi:MAG: GDP-L-fucose synthase [Verrucomicrobiae bacterium]|nr:GDP-L-fucose synthase [Verrucomicrobiae bacterium]